MLIWASHWQRREPYEYCFEAPEDYPLPANGYSINCALEDLVRNWCIARLAITAIKSSERTADKARLVAIIAAGALVLNAAVQLVGYFFAE